MTQWRNEDFENGYKAAVRDMLLILAETGAARFGPVGSKSYSIKPDDCGLCHGREGVVCDICGNGIKRPPDKIPTETEIEEYYWAACKRCGENVCVNMYGMGNCHRCGANLPFRDGNDMARLR